MIKNSFILLALFSLLASCHKTNDKTMTKIGFYCLDTLSNSTETATFNLYVDNEFKGKLHNLKYDARCGDSLMVVVTLDCKRHEIDVKNDAGEYLSSEYVQIGKNKSATGSGKNNGKVTLSSHGCNFSNMTGDDCATMCFTR